MEYGKKIEFDRLINTRDLGGFPASDGKTVRFGRLFRSGELTKASKPDQQRLSAEFRVKKIIDFRTGIEQQMKPDPEIDGAVHISNPILDEAAMGITREQENAQGRERDWTDQIIRLATAMKQQPTGYMEIMYENLVTDPHARKQYGRFLRLLSEDAGGAVLYHCTAGKDRVGTGTILLLLAFGVDRQLIVDDYLKTNAYYKEQNDQMAEEILRRTGDREIAASARDLYEVKESYIEKVFQVVGADQGSVYRYLREGLDIGEIRIGQMKELYLG